MPAHVGVDPGGAEIPDSSLPIDDPAALDIRHFTSVSATESAASVWAHVGPRRPSAPRFASVVSRTSASCPYLYLDGLDDDGSAVGDVADAAEKASPTGGAADGRAVDASCLALSEAVPVGRRQVALVCGGAGHVGCPRFAHGGLGERPVPPARLRSAIGFGPTVDRGARDLGLAAVRMLDVPVPVVSASADASVKEPPSAASAASALDAPATGAVAASSEAASEPTVSDRRVPERPGLPPTLAESAHAPASADAPKSAGAPESADAPTAVPAARAATGREPGSMRRPAGAPSRTARERGRTPGATRVASQAHRRAVAVRPATLASVVVLVAAFVVALAFVAGRGGLNVPGLGPATPSLLAVATESAIPSPTHRPTASPSVPSPSPTRTPKPTKSPAPSASPTATLAPDVLALLTPCADTPDCFQYRVRSGDNLHKIADLFGVAYTTLLSLNPEITNPSLIHVGQVIKLPPPTSP